MCDDESEMSLLELITGVFFIYLLFKFLAFSCRVFVGIIVWFFSSWRFEVKKDPQGNPVSTGEESLHLLSINVLPILAVVAVIVITVTWSDEPIHRELSPISSSYAMVITNSLKVREFGNLEAKVINGLSMNEQVKVIDKHNGWSKIEYQGQSGWVVSRYLQKK